MKKLKRRVLQDPAADDLLLRRAASCHVYSRPDVGRNRALALLFSFNCRHCPGSRQGSATRGHAAVDQSFSNKPLIYNIAWKTVIYLLISAVLHYLERLIDFWRETGSFVAGNEKLLSLIIWPHFFAIQILLLVLIAMYCTVHELVRVIGREKAMRIFFGPMPIPKV